MTKGDNKQLTLLIISLLNVALLSLGHAYNSKVLLWGALAVFSASVILSNKSNLLPLMLFYLPWSAVLKARPNTFTFFTIVVPVVFTMILLRGFKKGQKFKIGLIALPYILTVYTLSVKWLNGLPFHLPYLFFMIMLFFIPVYIERYKENISFERCVLFLTAGVLTACASSEMLMNYPHMLRYIDVYKWENIGLTRLSGFNGDSNYYAAQILVAIASVLTVLYKTSKKSLAVLQIGAIMALIYYGMQAVSKMFLLSLAILAILWVFSLLTDNRKASYKFSLFAIVVFAVGIAAASGLFSDFISFYLLRFGLVSDVRTLTTGRIGLMGVYLNYLFSNPDKLLFGVGLSQDQVRTLLHTNNAHNTIIEITYQLGIIGGSLLLWWWVKIYREFVEKTRLYFSDRNYFLIMAAAVFLPWMSLDILYFDEFFYFTLLLFLSKKYLSESINARISDNYNQAAGVR